jgi:hypothetical protein
MTKKKTVGFVTFGTYDVWVINNMGHFTFGSSDVFLNFGAYVASYQ